MAAAAAEAVPIEAANPPSRNSRAWVSFGCCLAGVGIAVGVVAVVAGDVTVMVWVQVAGIVPLGCPWLAGKVKGLAEASGRAARSSGINVMASIVLMSLESLAKLQFENSIPSEQVL